MYYRLFDRQCDRYMATGYNAKSRKELADDYVNYKSVDWENDMIDIFDNMSLKSKLQIILDDEFDIEKSKTKFELVR